MTRKASGLISCAALFVSWLLLAGAIQICHLRLNSLLSQEDANRPAVVLPRYDVVKFLAGGNESLLADIWWLAFIQYFGDLKNRKLDHNKYAYDYLDLITRLDPTFTQPYWFAAFAVGSEYSCPDLAAKILDRGIRENPDSWYLPFIAGINQYLFAHNEREAARYYHLAAKRKEAPEWIERQARVLEKQMPSFFKEINIWTEIYSRANDDVIRERARRKLISMWRIVIQTAPAEAPRKFAREQLKGLGAAVENPK